MNRRRHGLTVIELLVVFGIITTLLALAGSAAFKVSREARSSMCRSNLRQLALATESYRNVNDGGLQALVNHVNTIVMPVTCCYLRWHVHAPSRGRTCHLVACCARLAVGAPKTCHQTEKHATW